ncbi:MAG: ketoacyl-ACP synthase III [Spirochaetaceae bacterium]|nr:MAG: ketoacyl-ACP synthase III [Spirochaetaceae bacterium]
MPSRIAAVASYVPPRVITNDELATFVDTSDEWIFSHTGIRKRHIADDDVSASDLGVEAANRVLAKAGVPAAAIDLIVLATSTPDYPGLPSTAAIVQDRIGATRAGAMDIVAACTGFSYSLTTAKAFVDSGAADTVLVIGAEVYSKIVNWSDRSSCVLFGDGAAATIVTASDEPGIVDGVLHSQGSGANTLLRPAGGSREAYEPGVTPVERTKLFMDGRRVYHFAIQAIIDVVAELLDRNGLTMDQIDHIVPHQANARIIEAACKRASLPIDKFFMNIAEYANTSAASIPIALTEMEERGILSRGQRVITVGFGAGLTYGGNLLVW